MPSMILVASKIWWDGFEHEHRNWPFCILLNFGDKRRPKMQAVEVKIGPFDYGGEPTFLHGPTQFRQMYFDFIVKCVQRGNGKVSLAYAFYTETTEAELSQKGRRDFTRYLFKEIRGEGYQWGRLQVEYDEIHSMSSIPGKRLDWSPNHDKDFCFCYFWVNFARENIREGSFGLFKMTRLINLDVEQLREQDEDSDSSDDESSDSSSEVPMNNNDIVYRLLTLIR